MKDTIRKINHVRSIIRYSRMESEREQKEMVDEVIGTAKALNGLFNEVCRTVDSVKNNKQGKRLEDFLKSLEQDDLK